jgi:hypothetical protein
MANKSKRKGNRYERHVAKLLSEFTGVTFRKVFGSGMINKGAGQVIAPSYFCGDVTCDREDFVFSVEAKNRKNLVLPPVLYADNSKCEFTTAWAQCIDDSEENQKLPMFWFKPNHTDDWVALDEKSVERLKINPTVPRLVFDIYHHKMNIKIRKGQGIEKIYRELPNPILYRWRVLENNCDPSLMFENSI